MLHYSGLLGGLVTIASVGLQLLAAPPYFWGQNVGLLNLGPIVGTLVGGLSTYILIDLLTKRNAKRATSGYAEPESRLPILALGLFLATTGILTFGFSAANPEPTAWAGPVVGYGMVSEGGMATLDMLANAFVPGRIWNHGGAKCRLQLLDRRVRLDGERLLRDDNHQS
jgi:hypothetical protein